MNYLIIIDIETTGLSPESCEITEIGALKVSAETFEVVDQFSSLVRIKTSVPYFITNLTGITDSMLRRDGKSLNNVLNELSDFCQHHDVYAHNASFDKRFIRHYLEKENINYIQSEWIDTISIFKKHLPGRKTYKLESLITDFKLASKEDHRAISDANYTRVLLKKVLNK